MEVAEAHGYLLESLKVNVGKFFAPGEHLSLGAGKIYKDVRYPIYDATRSIFQTASGIVLVLTHECDVDQANARLFNDHVLVCPLLPFEIFIAKYQKKLGEAQLRSFLVSLGNREISRVLYTPHHPSMPYGSLMYLNQITNTHVSAFDPEKATTLCALTAYGLSIVDQVLTNHLLRPKSERLPFDYSSPLI